MSWGKISLARTKLLPTSIDPRPPLALKPHQDLDHIRMQPAKVELMGCPRDTDKPDATPPQGRAFLRVKDALARSLSNRLDFTKVLWDNGHSFCG